MNKGFRKKITLITSATIMIGTMSSLAGCGKDSVRDSSERTTQSIVSADVSEVLSVTDNETSSTNKTTGSDEKTTKSASNSTTEGTTKATTEKTDKKTTEKTTKATTEGSTKTTTERTTRETTEAAGITTKESVWSTTERSTRATTEASTRSTKENVVVNNTTEKTTQRTTTETVNKPQTTENVTIPQTTEYTTKADATESTTKVQTTEAPQHNHNWVWKTHTETVHHEAVTHEEPIYDWDYDMPNSCGITWNGEFVWGQPVEVTKIHCGVCGNFYDSYEDFYANDACKGASFGEQTVVIDVIPAEKIIVGYDTIVDKEAYDEVVEVKDYEYCSECGQKK